MTRSHFSLALLCYPNKLLEYIKHKRVVNGVDYSSGTATTANQTRANDKLVRTHFESQRSHVFLYSIHSSPQRLKSATRFGFSFPSF